MYSTELKGTFLALYRIAFTWITDATFLIHFLNLAQLCILYIRKCIISNVALVFRSKHKKFVRFLWFFLYLVMPGLLLLEETQPLLSGCQQLMLAVNLLLLTQSHGAQLAQRQLYAFRQLKLTKNQIKNQILIQNKKNINVPKINTKKKKSMI